MNGPQNDGAASAAPGTTTILTSWKEIAGFFGKSVRTVQRWERHFALPVRRPKNAVTGIVLADARELARLARAADARGGRLRRLAHPAVRPLRRAGVAGGVPARALRRARARRGALRRPAGRLPLQTPPAGVELRSHRGCAFTDQASPTAVRVTRYATPSPGGARRSSSRINALRVGLPYATVRPWFTKSDGFSAAHSPPLPA